MRFLRGLAISSAAVVALALIATGVAMYSFQPAAPPAHRVFLNGNILTMNADNDIVQAVSIRNERIEASGTTEAIRDLVTTGTVVVDLAGRTMIPGFIDAHGHFPGSGADEVAANLSSPPVGSVKSIADLLNALRERSALTSSRDWVFGYGYDDTLLAEKRHPTRDDLDRVSTSQPIFIAHVSGHLAVANSPALEALGIDRDTTPPDGGVIAKDASGEPTGVLEETAIAAGMNRLTDRSLFEALRVVRAAVADYAAKGVTTAQSGAVDSRMLSGLYWASRLGLIPFRLVVWPEHDRMGGELLSGSFDAAAYRTDEFLVNAVKLIADGSIQGYTGYLSEPYHQPFHGDASYRGYPTVSRDNLFELVERYHEAGWQLAIHGNGDASIEDILDAVEAAQNKRRDPDARTILIHAQMARDDQLDRMAELSVTPSFFSAHTYYWGDRHWTTFMGPERARRMSPTRSAADRGLRFTVHLDTPVVPMDPMLLVWSTVNRISTGGRIIGEEQRLTPMEALRAITIDAAWQIRREAELGSVEAGKLADLVILSRNPLENAEAIRDITVLETIVNGRTIYAASHD